MRKSYNVLLFFLVFLGRDCIAQDTTLTLNINEFLRIIKTYHPVVKQATLQVERASANVRAARGAFDPEITATADRKTFDGKLYYSYLNPQLTIPTWYGIDVKAGLEEVTGDRVTSEATLGQTSYVGLKLPANNLLFDRRRAALRQAQSLRQMTEAERLVAINDLLYDALSSYWNWTYEYYNYQVIREAVKVNEERLKYVRIEYELGARPAIDTTEVLAQLQNFYLQQNNAWLSFQTAGLDLSNYLWIENNIPMDWTENILPSHGDLHDSKIVPELEYLISTVSSNHPKLRSLTFKTDVLEIDRKLKAQYLMPKLSVNANLLNKGYTIPDNFTTPFLENNYKLGVDFTMPLFLREARGNYTAAKIKLQEINLERDQTTLQIENKIKSYYNQVLQLDKQISTSEQALLNYKRLFQGEKIKFETGESTLFLLNSRENKVLEATQKLYELRAKRQKSHAALLWASGLLS